MNRHTSTRLATGSLVVLAFAAGRFWPATELGAAPAVPVELSYDGSLLWATATDPHRPIVVFGAADADWPDYDEGDTILHLAKSGVEGVPVPVAVPGIDRAVVYELRPVGSWDLAGGFRPCIDGPFECDFLPVPPLPPRPPRMLTLAQVPVP
jgi:hypothetical protein